MGPKTKLLLISFSPFLLGYILFALTPYWAYLFMGLAVIAFWFFIGGYSTKVIQSRITAITVLNFIAFVLMLENLLFLLLLSIHDGNLSGLPTPLFHVIVFLRHLTYYYHFPLDHLIDSTIEFLYTVFEGNYPLTLVTPYSYIAVFARFVYILTASSLGRIAEERFALSERLKPIGQTKMKKAKPAVLAQKALVQIKVAYFTAFFVVGVYLLLMCVAFFISGGYYISPSSMDTIAFFYYGAYLALAIILRIKKNRIAAIGLFSITLLAFVIDFNSNPVNILLSLFFLTASFFGILGTFTYYRIEKQSQKSDKFQE